jgi:hypothetical protein
MSDNLFSRRDFLRLLGITAVGLRFAPEYLMSAAAPLRARALVATPVHTGPGQDTPVHQHLWPDSIVEINHQSNGWYHISGGYVRQEDLQPMQPPETSRTTAALPFWAAVTGAAAPIRAWCAADAPLVTRIGHGGTAYVVDYLALGWYGLLDAGGGWLGWTQAAPWQAITPGTPPTITRLVFDSQAFTLTAYHHDQEILRGPATSGIRPGPGSYRITGQRPGGIAHAGASLYHGAPWQLEIAGLGWLSGVYWHNRFSGPAQGPAVQVSVYLARWLYGYNGVLQIV